MNFKKLPVLLLALLFIVIGFAICFFSVSKNKKVNFENTSYTVQFREMEKQNLSDVIDTANQIFTQKNPQTADTLIELGKIKDSLLVIQGKLETSIRYQKESPLRHQMYLTLDTVKDLILATREIILNGALEMLQPTNTSFRALLKDMQKQTSQLQNIAHNVDVVSEIVASLTNIIASPIFTTTLSATPSP